VFHHRLSPVDCRKSHVDSERDAEGTTRRAGRKNGSLRKASPKRHEKSEFAIWTIRVRTEVRREMKMPAMGDEGREKQSRRRDSHPHEPRYELGAFLGSRHTGREQRDKDSNPVRRLWRPRALPGASLCGNSCLVFCSPRRSGDRRAQTQNTKYETPN